MAVAYTTVTPPGLLSQQYPPPLLPKPGKDNLRLQKLLKRTAKKKASAQASQSATSFRSNLSPVNEASPDLEHSDHFTPPRTPETPPSLYSYQPPPRFTVRPLYQHVPSPYPQRAVYGRAARMSPQTVAIPSYSYTQHVTTVSAYSGSAQLTGITQVTQMSAPAVWMASSVPEATVPAAEMKKPQAGLRPTTAVTTPQTKPSSPGPTSYPTAGGQALIRPLTVLTPLVKPKSPRPTFKATEPSKSPKPMFDVPQIRMYTASTSYYETSRTPPVYDTAGLTAIGSMVPQGKTASETKQDVFDMRRGTTPTAENNATTAPAAEVKRATPTSEVRRATPTSEVKRATPTSEVKRATPTSEVKRATPTSEVKRATPTSEVKRATSTAEVKRATPTAEVKRATPTSEVKRATPTSEVKRATLTPEVKRATLTPEVKRATPTAEVKRATPTSEVKRATPTSEVKRATPTSNYEFQTSRTTAGRPRTPAYRVMRATTPVFEISRPNPLLFAVSPVTVESERSLQTPSAASASSASQSVKAAEPHEIMVNGDIQQSDMKPAAKPVQPSITKSRSEPDLRRGTTAPIGSQRTPLLVPTTPGTTFQRSKTPTYEATRLMATMPAYKRPRTPTHGSSPVGFQRPKTPTQVSQKSAYRGLTPAEYAAHGGIKTYTPAYGISGSMISTQEEAEGQKELSEQSIAPAPEPCVKSETPKDVDKPLRDEKVAIAASVPVIVVTQASDSSGMILPREMSTDSGQAAAKQEPALIPETPKSKPPPAEKQKVEVEDTKPKTKTPEVKCPAPKSADQDPLKAVRKLLGKTQVQAPEPKAATETKTEVSKPKEPLASTKSSKPDSAAPPLPVKVPAAETGTDDKAKDKKAGLASEAKPSVEKKEGDKPLPAAEPLLKAMLKPKGASKTSGWSRLKKHMVVEQEEPKFPETGSQKEATEPGPIEAKKPDVKAEDQPRTEDETESKDAPKATKMWDAVLFQMFSSKENIMHQIELNKSEEEKKQETKGETTEIPSFAYRLPVLLFSPKFDAKRLKEAASRPVTKISTVFEMGLIGRKGKEEEPKDFNRTAKGFAAT
ncbi:neurofilament heavy polypeptide [Parambassis ranga]|uniref:Neurofilament heavy polypeptide n=1 Tax=Parambassis ranga TaxID=210632 RepID=A0A6P7K8H7_9TELE|nr:neurofilament heavy polypeptide-like [Parambassis ranga]